MSKLKDYYRFFDVFKGKLNDDQKKILEGLEDQLIAEEILPAISESVAPVLGALRRNLTLVVDYDTERGITVKTTRGEVVVKEHTAKSYEIPATNKVVKVAEVETTDEESNDDTPAERAKGTKGPKVPFAVKIGGKAVEGKDAASVFVETLRRFGFERVASVGIKYYNGKYNLADRQQRPGRKWQHECDGWYIYTCSATPRKAEDLILIAQKLHIDDLEVIVNGEVVFPKH